MLHALTWTFKTTLYVVVILVMGSVIRWNGQTISDHVRAGLFETGALIAETTREWAETMIRDPKESRLKSAAVAISNSAKKLRERRKELNARAHGAADADVSDTEREKLRALVNELNEQE